ncbi:hypothetical protein Rin_00003200 [Candidatus Regiella insecticola 5.15]|uniref:Type III secretion system protein, YseE family n=1 Tax=Candidatus Regiella insecticola 5.15 TaxID=1005043 RepID=G2GX35_9ENTR|nr:EscE/YscE/SsaE family type III secretion system needle protein co-chaperone [Candidatus Regiella insecticola]EGY29699.1 hypothetical protein Rin_00003200 [Candidatus Regiella insecticola 5.15]
MQRITELENCIKYDHEQTQAKLDELAEALIQLKKMTSIPEKPEIQKQFLQLTEAVLSAQKIIETLACRYQKKGGY